MLNVFSLVSVSVNIIPDNAEVYAPPDTRLKISSAWKSGSCMHEHSRTVTYISSLVEMKPFGQVMKQTWRRGQ